VLGLGLLRAAAGQAPSPPVLVLLAASAGVLGVMARDRRLSNRAAKNRAEQGAGSTVFQAEHPLVRVHPETGERTLLLGYHAQKFLGLNRADSARLIGLFQDHITRPENTVRWHWALGDVALWDNAATQHYGIGDFGEKRVLHRSSIEGEVPISIDGRRSVLRRGG